MCTSKGVKWQLYETFTSGLEGSFILLPLFPYVSCLLFLLGHSALSMKDRRIVRLPAVCDDVVTDQLLGRLLAILF